MIVHMLGIDISKLKFDVCLILQTGKLRHKVFPNTVAGCQQLSAWLTKHHVERVHACLEATGTYSEPLALYLHAAGHVVSVVNPAMIKAHAQSNLSRTKTDKVDAALVADFCATKHPATWQPPPPEARELQALVRRLESLQEMRQMEQNRLEEGLPTERVAASLREHIVYLEQEIASTQGSIAEHINDHPELRQQRDLLVSIPGIGETTAAKLLGEVHNIKLYKSARQLAAFAGLAPRLHESGTSVKKKAKLSKIGTPRLRKALYFPAISALKHNTHIKMMGDRLKLKGKCPMQIIGAAMRKLIHLAYGVLKSGQPFAADWAKNTA